MIWDLDLYGSFRNSEDQFDLKTNASNHRLQPISQRRLPKIVIGRPQLSSLWRSGQTPAAPGRFHSKPSTNINPSWFQANIISIFTVKSNTQSECHFQIITRYRMFIINIESNQKWKTVEYIEINIVESIVFVFWHRQVTSWFYQSGASGW